MTTMNRATYLQGRWKFREEANVKVLVRIWSFATSAAYNSSSIVSMSAWHRWAQIVNPLVSRANFFTSGIAVQLTFKNVNGLVMEANFFSQSVNPLE